VEARILGAMMEKELTTPENYPLTLNSLTLACNQKTSREPVMELTQGEVGSCVRQLQERQLVSGESGARADRYAQKLTKTLNLDKAGQAVLNIMLLRGPQTLNELLTRSQRMWQFQDAAAVENTVNALAQRAEPLVQKIPRQSGQREDRYMHLLCGKPGIQASQPERVTRSANADLEERIAKLEQQVALLLERSGL
ncbi:MAG TPA: YceH family protein, partial [Gammaproteobacteria bacterium]|nr:YceH family protein [Gammaproteobacteria bacterium]